MTAATERIELNMEELEALLERAREAVGPKGYEKLKAAIGTLAHLTQLLEDKKMTIKRLRQMLFGARSEKTHTVLKKKNPKGGGGRNKDGTGKKRGHGRNGSSSYDGADKIWIGHQSLKAGDPCPGCRKGKVYQQARPVTLVRIVGQPPIGATVYERESLRCNLCGEVFKAEAPAGVGKDKYDDTSASMIALLKYGSGLPFYRLQRLQSSVGIPLPAATQWEIVAEMAEVVQPAYEELIRQAAQGKVLHNDDTNMKVLELMVEEPTSDGSDDSSSERKGVFTSGIVSTREERPVALFFTGHRHAGENLAEVLQRRACQLGPPIQMCDALARNMPRELEAIVANCLAHGRRKFVDVAASFPAECRYVLETLGEVYRNDALAREQEMSPQQRLLLHQSQSRPLMDKLYKWFTAQLEEKKVEPNSGLGAAITYMRKRWQKLTLFLRVAGGPLDNNICERALKKAILHRKNSLFYKTMKGAHVGDLVMSLIHTCQLCGTNPFDYLNELQRHSHQLRQQPQQWLPWNYRQTLQQGNTTPQAPT